MADSRDCEMLKYRRDMCEYCERRQGQGLWLMHGQWFNIDSRACLQSRHHAVSEQRYQALLADSGLGTLGLTHTLSVWNLDAHNQECYEYVSHWLPKHYRGFFLQGEVGRGKSYALEAMTQRLCRVGVRTLYLPAASYLEQLRKSYNIKGVNESDIIGPLADVPVLMLDDLGKEGFSDVEWAGSRIYTLINQRYEAMKPTHVSSNWSPNALESRYGANHGPAIISRLLEMTRVIVLGGPDRRMTSR